MKFQAEIDVMPLDELLDPQGKVVTSGLHNLSMKSIDNVRIGKHMTMEVEAKDEQEAEQQVDKACRELLANPVIEKYHFRIHKASES